MDLQQISLRVTKNGAERALVVGGVGSGKSTLADYLGTDFTRRYTKSRRLIADTKPRYRAEVTIQGRKAKHLYKKWGHGQAVPGSVLVYEPEDLALAWDLGYRVAIVQGESMADLVRVLDVCEAFFRQANAKVPSLLQVDETCDFFSANGYPKGGSDVMIRVARAGRERGLGGLYCSQRTRAIPVSIIEEMERLYLFRLDAAGDIKRLEEMGAPVTVDDMPREEHAFVYWRKRGGYDDLYGPYRLAL